MPLREFGGGYAHGRLRELKVDTQMHACRMNDFISMRVTIAKERKFPN